jgi:phosphoribosylformylglycinamidine synthase
MQFTATTVVPDVRECVTMDVKVPGDVLYVLGVTRNELGGSEYYDLFGETGVNVPRVRPEENRKLYAALEGAIRQGLAASCHGIHRGGLGVHAAMTAIGGGLGLELDLARVPVEGTLRDDQVLFSESAGRFLVTVAPENRARFEACFKDLPFAEAGRVTETPSFVVTGVGGGIVMDEPIALLKDVWQGPFKEN